MKTNIEIEQRYQVDDAAAMASLLARHGVDLQSEQRIIDQWFVPQSVHTRIQHDRWFDQDHGVAYRIRRTALHNGQSHIILDSKQHTEADNHNTFKEDVVMSDDYEAMLHFLESKGYYNWLTLDKKRQHFSSPQADLSITMDKVAGIKDVLGIDTVLELEYKGKASRDRALSIINGFAATLGLSLDSQFAKSLTVESIRVLAKFQ